MLATWRYSLISIYQSPEQIKAPFGLHMKKRKQPTSHSSKPKLNPSNIQTLNKLLVSVLEQRQKGYFQNIPQLLDSAIKILPNDANLWLEKGIAHYDLGEMLKAIQSYEKAIRLDPECHKAFNNMGNALRARKEYVASVNAFLKAIEINGTETSYFLNMGLSLRDAGMNEAALQAFSKALDLDDANPESYFQLGLTCILNANPHAALSLLIKATELKKDDPLYLYNLAIAYKETQQIDLARVCLDKAINILPNFTHAQYQKVLLARQQCDWGSWEQDIQTIRQMLATEVEQSIVNPYLLITYPEFKPAEVKLVAERYMRQMTNAWTGQTLVEKGKPVTSSRKIRIGYLSADFCYHATAILMIGMLEARDTAKFDTYLYSYKKNIANDEWVTRCKYASEVYRDISQMDDLQAAQVIASDEIDILVDLKGFTTEARLNISMYRPAPILVSWLGYPGTLGHKQAADYIIGDKWVTPVSCASDYSETLAIMPNCYQPNMYWESLPEPQSRSELGLPEESIVFCNFNQTYKYTPQIFKLWCRIMLKVDNSVMWLLKPSSEQAIKNICKEAEGMGISQDRIIFAPKLDIYEHCVRLQQADLSLDTFPYTSHTTARDALWAGVPIVTKMGDSFASRVAGSLLATFGLPELIANDDLEYVEIASTLAADTDRLRQLKLRTRNLRPNNPLFDPSGFARNIEGLYLQMVERTRLKTDEIGPLQGERINES